MTYNPLDLFDANTRLAGNLPRLDHRNLYISRLAASLRSNLDDGLSRLITDNKQSATIRNDAADRSIDDVYFRDAASDVQSTHRLAFHLHSLAAINVVLRTTRCHHQWPGSHRDSCDARLGTLRHLRFRIVLRCSRWQRSHDRSSDHCIGCSVNRVCRRLKGFRCWLNGFDCRYRSLGRRFIRL